MFPVYWYFKVLEKFTQKMIGCSELGLLSKSRSGKKYIVCQIYVYNTCLTYVTCDIFKMIAIKQ